MSEPQPTPESPQVTRLLIALGEEGQGHIAEMLLPLVYDELRSLARAQMGREGSPQTLQPTALVHEAYLRLIGDRELKWSSRRHFFAAAAQAMRRILVESARRRKQLKRGGNRQREDVFETPVAVEPQDTHLIELDTVLAQLESRDPRKAEIVMLRYFAGLTIEQTALVMGLSTATIKAEWSYARAWLYRQISNDGETPSKDGLP
jgi:RNA polymerase sigma factor (TIGR02999 family)